MSKKSIKQYTIRAFDPVKEAFFDCLGNISKLATSHEVVVTKQLEAAVEMMRLPTTPDKLLSNMSFKITDKRADPTATAAEIVSIDLQIETEAKSANELKVYREHIINAINTWAEKSRVKGLRGFRASAVKAPTFKKSETTGLVVIKTNVLLGTAVFYNKNQVTVEANTPEVVAEDLRNLYKALEKEMGSFLVGIRYDHSVTGYGEATPTRDHLNAQVTPQVSPVLAPWSVLIVN